jgi:radical SAM superfamily enzyme YgiQ (UPF0313 family)
MGERREHVVFISFTVDDPATVPYWDYFRAEPSVSWVAGAINEPKWSSVVIDGDRLDDEEIWVRIAASSPSVIGISCFTAGYSRGLRVARRVKEKAPKTIVIFGGWHPSACPDEVLEEQCVDMVVVGAGERVINEILRDPHGYTGRILRADDFPFVQRGRPTRERSTQAPYFQFFGAPPLRDQRAASITLGGGGCAFRCSYCCTPAIYRGLQPARSATEICDELQELVEAFGVNYVFIRDENPPLYRKLLEEVCEKLIETGINRHIRLHSFADTRLMDQPLLELMARAGWTGLTYGVESFRPDQLRSMHRNPDLRQMHRVFEWTRAVGIFSTANVILWKPGDSFESFEACLPALVQLLPDEVLFLFFVPFPGTADASRCASMPRRTERLEDYHLLQPILEIDPGVSTEDLHRERRRVLDAYYRSGEYAGLMSLRKRQFGADFEGMTEVRRSRMLRYGFDIWNLQPVPTSSCLAYV